MTDTHAGGCVTVVEVLIPGPQGPGGTGSSGIGGHPVAIENVEVGHVIVFDGEAWENRPLVTPGDMTKAVYDTDDDGKVDAAEVADTVAWTGVTGAPETFPPAAHGHAIAGVTGLDDALAEKAPLISPALTGTPTAPTANPGTDTDQLATTAFVADAIAAIPGSGTPAWDDIDGKPETFPPSAHGHVIGDVSGLGGLAAKDSVGVADIDAAGAASSSTFLRGDGEWAAPGGSGDLLAANNLADLDDAAAARGNLGLGQMALEDEVSWNDIDGMPETFPPAAHGHAMGDVTGLSDALAAKADAGDIPAVPAIASVATVRAGTDAGETLGVKNTLDAHAPVALVDAATIAIDLAQGIVFTVTLGGNRTLASPTNQIAGRSGLVIVKQDGTGSRTLSFGGDWTFQGGAPDLSTAAGAVDIVAWYVEASGTVRAGFLKGA